MCGIIGKLKTKNRIPVNTEAILAFEDQRHRGSQGFGSLFINPEEEILVKRATGETKFQVDVALSPAAGVFLHHRAPTSSRNTIKGTHPIRVSHGSLTCDWYILHNGIIRNAAQLKKEHEDELGFIYTTKETTGPEYFKHYNYEDFNDSEALAIEIARYIECQTRTIEALGSAAFIAVQVDKKTNQAKTIHFGTNGTNPLKVAVNRGELSIQSEGKGEAIKENILYSAQIEWEKDIKLIKRQLRFAASYHSESIAPWKPAEATPKQTTITYNQIKEKQATEQLKVQAETIQKEQPKKETTLEDKIKAEQRNEEALEHFITEWDQEIYGPTDEMDEEFTGEFSIKEMERAANKLEEIIYEALNTLDCPDALDTFNIDDYTGQLRTVLLHAFQIAESYAIKNSVTSGEFIES